MSMFEKIEADVRNLIEAVLNERAFPSKEEVAQITRRTLATEMQDLISEEITKHIEAVKAMAQVAAETAKSSTPKNGGGRGRKPKYLTEEDKNRARAGYQRKHRHNAMIKTMIAAGATPDVIQKANEEFEAREAAFARGDALPSRRGRKPAVIGGDGIDMGSMGTGSVDSYGISTGTIEAHRHGSVDSTEPSTATPAPVRTLPARIPSISRVNEISLDV